MSEYDIYDELDIRVHNGIRFFVVKDYELVTTDELKKVDAIVIEYISEHDSLSLIRMIRTHVERKVYLLPIFIVRASEFQSPMISSLIDGRLSSLDKLDTPSSIASAIIHRMEEST